jgi:NodT family efflux transporter outer membrane factor (OMF) lipoprotein
MRRAFGAVASLVLMSSCMVGPKYVKPALTAPASAPKNGPDAYKELDPNWKPANPADTALKGDWWTMFNEPVLNDLEKQVARENQSLKAYEARFREARAQIRINRAGLYPTVGGSASTIGERYSASRPYFNAASANNGEADLQLPLDLNYEVDLWGRIHRTINAAKEETQASAADLATAKLSLQAELAIDYFELRSADAQRKLLSDTVSDYQEALRITTNRFEGGISAESDVYQAQTQLQAAMVAEQDTAVQRAAFEHAIAVLIGRSPAAFTLAEAPLASQPPYIPAGLPSELLERRPDIAAAERRANEANERIGIARAAYFPSLSLNAAIGFESTALTSLFNAASFVYALGPGLSQTFFDAGRRSAVSEQAYAGFDEAAANYRQTSLTAFQQVEDNLAALRILSQEAVQQHAATIAAQGAQRIFNNRYVGGIDTYLQVVTAQNAALSNERNEIDIMRRRMDSSVLLVKALGGGWNTGLLPVL